MGITIAIVLASLLFGLLPDESRKELNIRKKIAESLAIQLVTALHQNDLRTIRNTISLIEGRKSDVLSIALRKADGSIMAASDGHAIFWAGADPNRSIPTHVHVPIHNEDSIWGNIEIAFRPLSSDKTIMGLPKTVFLFLGFLGAVGFISFYALLRRALRELDPGGIIPKRVQTAFDTLAEGVVIIDEHESILLVNQSFSNVFGQMDETFFGKKMNDFAWRERNSTERVRDFPWSDALREKCTLTAVRLDVLDVSGKVRSFKVNASCILNEKDKVSGAIVTFDDNTELEQRNEDLIQSIEQLKLSELEICRQNEELYYLANHDPLSKCLNRRAFFVNVDEYVESCPHEEFSICCMMVDLDHFKSINDRFGHAVGDDVIVGVAAILRSHVKDLGFVGRYGGEEYCIAMFGLEKEACKNLAETIRNEIYELSSSWLPVDERVTASLGLAISKKRNCPVQDVINQADRALYLAKESGRNQSIFWDEIPRNCSTGSERSLAVTA
ncbi:MAG: sensor domain-containing diguanylate cyclase [Alphaproteobacteria bacterium]